MRAAGAEGEASTVEEVWAWLAAPEHRTLLVLWTEAYAARSSSRTAVVGLRAATWGLAALLTWALGHGDLSLACCVAPSRPVGDR